MYVFKDISKDELNDFNYSSKKGHLFQCSNWGEVKESWISKYIGGFKENTDEMVLSSLILIRKLPFLPRYIGYIPRGFVCDYENETLLEEFFKYLEKFMKDNKIAFITLDPDIPYRVNDSINSKASKLLDFLYSKKIKVNSSTNFDSIQPGTVFRLALPKWDKDTIKAATFNKFSSTTKRNIKTASSRGLTTECYDSTNISQETLTNFYELMKITGKRDGFLVRDRNYFNILLNKLHPNITMYLVKYDYKKDFSYMNAKLTELRAKQDTLLDKLNQNSSNINISDKLKNSIKDLDRQILETKAKIASISIYEGKTIYLSGSIYAHYGNKAWYLYGASHDILRNTMPNYLMQWEMIKHSIDLGLELYDFRGTPKPTEANKNLSGLYKFKKGFGGDFIEFIGEIYIIRSKLLYFLYKTAFPRFKEIRSNLKK